METLLQKANIETTKRKRKIEEYSAIYVAMWPLYRWLRHYVNVAHNNNLLSTV